MPEVFSHPADIRRSQPKQTLPNPPQEHPNSWGRLKPQRNLLDKMHEVFPHNSITLWVNAAKARSYLGSRYETDVSSHRPIPAWGKIDSNHPSSKKGKEHSYCLKPRAFSFGVCPHTEPSHRVTVTVSSCPQCFTREKCSEQEGNRQSLKARGK